MTHALSLAVEAKEKLFNAERHHGCPQSAADRTAALIIRGDELVAEVSNPSLWFDHKPEPPGKGDCVD